MARTSQSWQLHKPIVVAPSQCFCGRWEAETADCPGAHGQLACHTQQQQETLSQTKQGLGIQGGPLFFIVCVSIQTEKEKCGFNFLPYQNHNQTIKKASDYVLFSSGIKLQDLWSRNGHQQITNFKSYENLIRLIMKINKKNYNHRSKHMMCINSPPKKSKFQTNK